MLWRREMRPGWRKGATWRFLCLECNESVYGRDVAEFAIRSDTCEGANRSIEDVTQLPRVPTVDTSGDVTGCHYAVYGARAWQKSLHLTGEYKCDCVACCADVQTTVVFRTPTPFSRHKNYWVLDKVRAIECLFCKKVSVYVEHHCKTEEWWNTSLWQKTGDNRFVCLQPCAYRHVRSSN